MIGENDLNIPLGSPAIQKKIGKDQSSVRIECVRFDLGAV